MLLMHTLDAEICVLDFVVHVIALMNGLVSLMNGPCANDVRVNMTECVISKYNMLEIPF